MRYLLVFLLLFTAFPAYAQFSGGVSTQGTVTPNDCTAFVNAYTIKDSGSTCGGGSGVAITGDVTVGSTGVSTVNTVSNNPYFNLTANSVTLATATFNAGGVAIGSSSVNGIVLQNTNPATNGGQQWSPQVDYIGQGWETSTSASQTVDCYQSLIPVQGSTNPSGQFSVWCRVNGGTYTNVFYITTSGTVMAPAGRFQSNVSGSAAYSVNGTGFFQFNNDTSVARQAAGVVEIGGASAGNTGTLLAGSIGIGTTGPIAPLSIVGSVAYYGTAPTCGTGCASITAGSTNTRGSMVSNSSVSAITLTFASTGAGPWTSAPFCTISDSNSSAVSDISALSSTSLTVSLASALSAVTIYWHCDQ